MIKTITANIPARSLKGKTKTFTYPARTDHFSCAGDGRWTITMDGAPEPVTEAEVIDICRRATNWPAIRAIHFPMDGFDSTEGLRS